MESGLKKQKSREGESCYFAEYCEMHQVSAETGPSVGGLQGHTLELL
jgi:hypothetical protein